MKLTHVRMMDNVVWFMDPDVRGRLTAQIRLLQIISDADNLILLILNLNWDFVFSLVESLKWQLGLVFGFLMQTRLVQNYPQWSSMSISTPNATVSTPTSNDYTSRTECISGWLKWKACCHSGHLWMTSPSLALDSLSHLCMAPQIAEWGSVHVWERGVWLLNQTAAVRVWSSTLNTAVNSIYLLKASHSASVSMVKNIWSSFPTASLWGQKQNKKRYKSGYLSRLIWESCGLAGWREVNSTGHYTQFERFIGKKNLIPSSTKQFWSQTRATW